MVDFSEWKQREHHGNMFIPDGIINDEYWNKSKVKILFLLKEAYTKKTKTNQTAWDLRTHINKKINQKKVSDRTFKPIAQWAYGIEKVYFDNEVAPYKESCEEMYDALSSSAIVNLKKSNGIKSSNKRDLEGYVEKDWDLLSLQINEINPQLVICGNTWSLINGKLIEKKKISDSAYLSNGIIYIDYWHPSNRASNQMNYYALCTMVLLAIKAKNSY